MHCFARVSLRVKAATRRTIARGRNRQAPSAAATYAPHLRYSTYAAIAGAHPLALDTELEGADQRLSSVFCQLNRRRRCGPHGRLLANSVPQYVGTPHQSTSRGPCCTSLLYTRSKRPVPRSEPASDLGALGGTRTPNLLIRSQMLYPLSYERSSSSIPRPARWLCPVQTVRGRAQRGLSI
jgi:hypothetical protein